MGAYHINNFAEQVQRAMPGKYYTTVAVKEGVDNGVRTYDVRRRRDGQFISGFKSVTLPGCCGVLVLFSFSGKAEALFECVSATLVAAKKSKFGAVQLTLTGGTLLTALSGHPDVAVQVYRNAKTGNNVSILTFNLRQPDPAPKKERAVEEDA